MFEFIKKIRGIIIPIFTKSPNVVIIRNITKLNPDEKLKLTEELSTLRSRIDDYNQENRETHNRRESEHNGKCSKCNSTNINGRIRRIKGEIAGRSSGDWGLSGEIDTLGVNKCNDCGHEWKIYEGKPFYIDYGDIIGYVNTLMRFVGKYSSGEIDWNPNDLSEKFTSKDEKIQSEINRTIEGFWGKNTLRFSGGLSLELLQYVVDIELGKYQMLYRSDIEEWESGDKGILIKYLGFKSLSDLYK